MAKRSRESIKRSVKAGVIGPIVCPICGQRFWTVEQEQAHQGGVLYGRRVCLYAPASPLVPEVSGPCWHGDSRSCMCEE